MMDPEERSKLERDFYKLMEQNRRSLIELATKEFTPAEQAAIRSAMAQRSDEMSVILTLLK